MEIFKKTVLTRRVSIPMAQMAHINHEILQTLRKLEGRCVEEGYLKTNSIQILNHTCGVLKGNNIILSVSFECQIANPELNQLLKCVVLDNSRAGIKARLDNKESPFIIFIPRNVELPDMNENDKIKVNVIAQRYEINDAKISIIASLHEKEKEKEKEVKAKETEPDVFVFHYKSADSKPGKGTHEVGDPKTYVELSRKKNWRQQLCHFDPCTFEWSGSHGITFPDAKWSTMEHFYQAAKLFLKDPVFANLLKVGEKHGASDGMTVKRVNKKSGKYVVELTPDQLRQWNDVKEEVMYDAAKAMFSQHPDKTEVLKATKQAHLMHYTRGKPLVRYTHYERVRNVLTSPN